MDDVRVFADTNTLIPFYICDFLLTCAEEEIFELLWSEDLLAELISVAVRLGKPESSVQGLCAAIRETFPDGEVSPRLL